MGAHGDRPAGASAAAGVTGPVPDGAASAGSAEGATETGGGSGAAPEVAGSRLALRLRGVGRRHGEHVALRDVDLDLPTGATLLVLGANGAGKSTLLRLLAGLLRPTAGSLEVLGCALPRRRHRLAGRVGWVGHRPLLHADLTARENLAHQARLRRLAPGTVAQALEAVGLSRRSAQPVATLSAGLRRRLDVARALLGTPELLLLDEPLANLDPAAANELAALLRGHGPGPRASGAGGGPPTRVLTSHDPRAALAEADLVLGLRRGRPVLLGPAADVDARDLAGLYA